MNEYSPTLSSISPRSSSFYLLCIKYIVISGIILSSWVSCQPLETGTATDSTTKEREQPKTTIAPTPDHPLTPSLLGVTESLYIDLGYSKTSFLYTTSRHKIFSNFFKRRKVMKLTILKRIKLCFEVMTIRSGHAHTAQEKQLSVFQRGYETGRTDEMLNNRSRRR